MSEWRKIWANGLPDEGPSPKSGHRMAAEWMAFLGLWNGSMISANLEVIWVMSDEGSLVPIFFEDHTTMNFFPKVLFATIFLFAMSAPTLASEKIGVVLLHGKLGTANYQSPIGQLASYLDDTFMVKARDMPWSKSDHFNKTLEESFEEIDGMVQDLREDGATKIFVGGHSIGASVALAYSTQRSGLAGILMIAPGHSPEKFAGRNVDALMKAKGLIAAGKANEEVRILDTDQGRTADYYLDADIAVSWFDAESLTSMPKAARIAKPDTPVLYIIGQSDFFHPAGKSLVFDQLPQHASTIYMVVHGTHMETPKVGRREIKAWINAVATGKPVSQQVQMKSSDQTRSMLSDWITANKKLCTSDEDNFADNLNDHIDELKSSEQIPSDFVISKFKLRRMYNDHCS